MKLFIHNENDDSLLQSDVNRCLAFRGDNEIIGSPKNGNYLGVLELVAEFDPFLSTHIKDHANKKSGHINYLSSTICEELIDLMAKEVLSEIITTIKKSKYFSVSVDSTPDEAHIDQLTIVLCYIEGINPVERFLTFVPNCGHTGIEMANTLITFLDHHKIELNDCRGQSYDNAANMSGKYQGMQALIKNKNQLAEFIPCWGHSLNLVGKTAANSCVAAIRFFDFIQTLYNLNETRWSCRADATKAVVFGYDYIKEALVEISNDLDQKDIVKIQSKKLYESMCQLEVAFYAIFRNDILERFDSTNHILQDPKIVLQTAVNALNSLLSFVREIRNKYEEYEEKAKDMSGLKDYAPIQNRKKNLSPREKIRSESFISVIVQLTVSLTERIAAYETIRQRFGFLNTFEKLETSELQSAANYLVSIYPNDLESSLAHPTSIP
ncbi:uncharacterized protein LOC132938900 [Metopolophium dirhodum]|uniref:uncharacterized protein LOC132938900 n=1 Tax=Metopolophium dirhodum TaxID=44670 RepID=UPI002990316C|nr:uncharacterized protein LOC132938900 [Metopolophium dirhodum]